MSLHPPSDRQASVPNPPSGQKAPAQDPDSQSDYWDREGPGKEYHFPVDLAQFDQLLGGNRSARILEFGCGYGRVAEMLFGRGYRAVEGVDLAPRMIELARKRLPELTFRVIDPPKLPHEDESF